MALKTIKKQDVQQESIDNLIQNNPEGMARKAATMEKKKEERKASTSEAWQKVIPLHRRVKQLDKLGMAYLNGKVKWTREQALVFNKMFETYSSKIMPPAKPKKGEDIKLQAINITGLPKGM